MLTEFLTSGFFLGLLIGAVLGAIFELLFKGAYDRLKSRLQAWRLKRNWEAANRAWEEYESIAPRLKVIQSGWKNGVFLENHVAVLLTKDYQMPDAIKRNILEPKRVKWEERRLENHELIGISDLIIYRTQEVIENSQEGTHRIVLKAQKYRYFDFLATHVIMYLGPQRERAFLNGLIGSRPHYSKPVTAFPNSLSVGLSLFCEGGGCLVLTARTEVQASGGHLLPGRIFNAVGENMNPTDVVGEYDGKQRLSPWLTAKRGLKEEMGMTYFDNFGWTLVLHSLVWDSRLLDYKMFGYLVTNLSRTEVKQLWLDAPDRSESKGLLYLETGNRSQCRSLVGRIHNERDDWTSEAALCTMRSLLQMGKVRAEDLHQLLIT